MEKMTDKPTRIAVVQHGDYRQALATIGSGQGETYFGMAYSLRVLDALLAPHPHLVISLNAPSYDEPHGLGRMVGMPHPHVPRFPASGTVGVWLWARQILKQVDAFKPTHLLLRTSGALGIAIAKYSTKRHINTLAILAAVMNSPSPRGRKIDRQFAELLNDENVFLVANNKAPSTQSLVDHGLKAEKAVPYEWEGERDPKDYAIKQLNPSAATTIFYAGTMDEAKGIGDLIQAVKLLRSQEKNVRLTIAGDGAAMTQMRALAEGAAADIKFLGRVPNARVFELMRASTIVCVPSRHSFPEGMPQSLTEALASRTPVVASDHPLFQKAFRDGEGVKFFRSPDPQSLADAVSEIVGSPEKYEQLSRTTLDADARVRCSNTFGDVVERWKATFSGATKNEQMTGGQSISSKSPHLVSSPSGRGLG